MGQEPRGGGARDEAGRAGPEPDQIWEEEGKPDGRALDHWLRARWELENAPDPKAELERLERESEPGRKTG